jgi:hypothetical protein
MTDGGLGSTGRRAALIAGLGMLAMTVVVILADMVSLRQIMVPGDAAATAANVIASDLMFRAGIWGMLVVLICDVVVAWGLYMLLEPVDARLSLFTAWLRVVYAVILGIALSALVVVAILLSNADYLSALETGQLHVYVLTLFNAYYEVWGVGFIIFGVHLLILGVLTLKSDYIPRFLGVLLVVAGVGYVGEYTGRLLFPDFDVPLSIAGWGELVFMFWLLWIGRPARWSQKAV